MIGESTDNIAMQAERLSELISDCAKDLRAKAGDMHKKGKVRQNYKVDS